MIKESADINYRVAIFFSNIAFCIPGLASTYICFLSVAVGLCYFQTTLLNVLQWLAATLYHS